MGRTPNEHQARITWSAALVDRGLPDVERTHDPSWLPGEDPHTGDGWSLECVFDPSPRVQGNPSLATIRYTMPGAPHHRLIPNARLCLFERWTQAMADVEILT